ITNAAVLYEKSAPMIDQFNENSLRKSAFRKRLLNGTATVAESRGEWAKAEKLLRELIAMDDENIGASQRLGRAIFQQAVIGDTPEKIKAENKMYSDSFQAFLAALKHDPKQLNPNIALGQLFEQKAQENIGDQKKFDYYRQKAAGLFKEATSKAPNDQAVLLAAASWALQTSQFKLAEQYADLALKADTNSADAKLARAIVARFLDDSATAEKLLSEAFTQSPANFAIINQLALALIDSQDSSKRGRARDLAEMNFRQYQQSPEALATLGWVYYVTGDLAKAEQALGQLLTANALNADSAYYVAKLFVDRGKLKEAKEILKMALDNPKPFASRIDAQALSMEVDKLIAKGGEAKASDAKKTETKAPAAK
ncbi:MAG: hypothetical protein SGJ20_18290, partial [Planctomycetota bacterium]|nr:hypothetical protein [Planctomycetota bacterium]